jgi:hypothetical protein
MEGGQAGPKETAGRPEGRPASPSPPLPSPRPGWVVVLGGLMLLFAFHLFLGGLSGLSGPGSPAVDGSGTVAGTEVAQAALRRALMQAFAQVDAGMLRTHAVAQIVLAVVMMFAVAAIATNDRRGRPAALAAAWVGIVYHLGSALFFVFVVRAGLLASAPSWIDQVVALTGGPDPGRSRQELLSSTSTLLLLAPLTVCLLGIGFSLIVMRFFGGPRGRAFYGVVALEGPSQPQPRG